MPSYTVTKGRLTVLATGIVRQFMFNPNDISDTKGTNYGLTNLSGASHPVYQFGSGGERIIPFELYLDGDRGRMGREPSPEGLSILSEVRFYQSLLYPREYDTHSFVAAFPSMVLLTIGTAFDALPCIVKKADVRYTYWTPKMEPVRATISLEFAEVVEESRTAAAVLLDL